MRIQLSRIPEWVKAGIYVIILIAIGTSGYMFIESYSWLDALYMTIITISTVGFREVYPLSDPGKIFTMFIILSSLGVVAYFISHLTQRLFKAQLSFFFSGNLKNLKLKKMENHIIVCGYGRNGKQVVEELTAFDEKVIVVDKDHELVVNNATQAFQVIEGDATEDEVLLKAGIARARALIATLPLDADNLFVVLTARALNPDLNIISRASSESAERKLHMAGVNSVVMPERVGGAHMATLVAHPDVMEFMEHLNIHGHSPVQLMEIACADLPEDLMHKPLKELELRKKTGANIIGYKTAGGEYILNPSPETKLYPHSKIFVLGTREQAEEMRRILRGGIPKIKSR
ncbi:potassium channel protein [Candidatus Sulfidibacterium hydrothermale]|uniref:potassium channel family protein n=1 Tax=Candidatus Sulfidibacterium hydrothermale TaxID=2875962 RepID=UPI001F0A7DA7|nr:potassium channel protein [Candidatus Sulfidibacterium hydrothermale]UBM62934.1 potassium channel protein [Candidatus Sulfidibacterium hydrothermale]